MKRRRRLQHGRGGSGLCRAVHASLTLGGITFLLSFGTSCFESEPARDPLRTPWEVRGAERVVSPPVIASDTPVQKTAVEVASPVATTCLAAGCHDGLTMTHDIHGRVVASSCDKCHIPVGPPSEHAFAPIEKDGNVCRTCHPSRATRRFVHAPFQEGQCLSCHRVHGGSERAGREMAAEAATCRKCHAPQEHKVVHGPYARGECLACHSPHESDFESLTRASSGSLCVSCHESELPSSDGSRVIAAVGAQVRSSRYRHGPIRDDACNACHRAHGTAYPHLLQTTFQPDFYQPFETERYALCFQCHNSALVVEERTTQATSFRDGDRNLHHVHVFQDKGRSCRACHHVHASNQPFHMRQTVPFGNWTLPIGFQRTPTGGTCDSGCHDAVSYDNR